MFFRPIICHRLFFALRPPPALAEQIAGSAQWFGGEGRFVLADNLHITLDISHDYPSFPDSLADAMLHAGAMVAAAPVPVVLDEANGKGGQVVLRPQRPIGELSALYAELAAARAATGWSQRRGYRFRPHSTLAYEAARDFRMAIRPIRWVADEFVLIHSLVGRTQHRLLGRWPLRAENGRQPSLF